VPAILTRAGVGQKLVGHVRQAERVVELSVGEQASVRGDHRAPKLQLQSAIEIEPRLRREVRSSPQLQMSRAIEDQAWYLAGRHLFEQHFGFNARGLAVKGPRPVQQR
jgi:hypothetical protein